MSERRIVITGMGAVTPLGLDVETTWANLLAGKSGAVPITTFDISKYDCRFACTVKDFEPKKYFFNEKDARRADRYSQLAMASAKEAVRHAGLDPQSLDLDRVGVLVGSGIGGLQALGEQDANLLLKGPGRVSPFMIPMMIANMAGGPDLHGIRFCRAEFRRGHRLRDLEQFHRRSLAPHPRRRGRRDPRGRQRSGLRPSGHERLCRDEGPQHPQRRARTRLPAVRQGPRRFRAGRRRGCRHRRGAGACEEARRQHPGRADRLRPQLRRLPHDVAPRPVASARSRRCSTR